MQGRGSPDWGWRRRWVLDTAIIYDEVSWTIVRSTIARGKQIAWLLKFVISRVLYASSVTRDEEILVSDNLESSRIWSVLFPFPMPATKKIFSLDRGWTWPGLRCSRNHGNYSIAVPLLWGLPRHPCLVISGDGHQPSQPHVIRLYTKSLHTYCFMSTNTAMPMFLTRWDRKAHIEIWSRED